jgi:hypothetical protein
MALSSRYRQAFARSAQNAAGPPIEVNGFTPGSVTAPAAILKGISMYAKTRRDEANTSAAEAAASAEKAAAKKSQDLTDTHTLASTNALTNPQARSAVPPAGVRGIPDADLKALGLTPDANGEVDPRAYAGATAKYGADKRATAAAGKPASAAAQKQDAHARAMQDFERNDAPLVGRHVAFLMGLPWKDNVTGKSYSPPSGSGYNITTKSVAAQHLGIDPQAWEENDPARFPENATANTAGATTDPDMNAAKRAAASRWRNAELQSAIDRFRTTRVNQYASQYLVPESLGGASSPAADTGDADNAKFEQDLMDMLGKSDQ